MENNNVRVQATPSHCTEQEVKELEVKEFIEELDLNYSKLEQKLTKGAKLVGNLEEGLSLELGEEEEKVAKETKKITNLIELKTVNVTIDGKELELMDIDGDKGINFVTNKFYSRPFEGSLDFICYSDDKGKLYLKSNGLHKYKVVDVINKTTTIENLVSTSDFKDVHQIGINRYSSGIDFKHAVMGSNHIKYETKNVNEQIDYFREAVLPNIIKINNKKVKGVIDNLITTLKLDLYDKYSTDTLAIYYNDTNLVGSYLTEIKCYSKVLNQEVEFLSLLENYFRENNMFTYPAITSMFIYFIQQVPEFLGTFRLVDLQGLYAGKDANLGINYETINKEVERVISNLKINSWSISNQVVDDYFKSIDSERRDLIIGCPKGEGNYFTKVIPSVGVDISDDNLVSLALTLDDLEKVEELLKECRTIVDEPEDKSLDEVLEIHAEPIRASMKVMDVEDDYLCYAEVELDLNKANKFQYCPKSKALLVREDFIDGVYKPVLKGE